MIPEIKRGDTVECLKCKRPILLDGHTFKLSFNGEYIHCPLCDWAYDVRAYHRYGTLIKTSGEKEK
jgi:hypothetical protein